MDNNKEKTEQKLLDELEDALNCENKLNLTADAKDDEDDGDLDKDFTNFMNQLKGGQGGQEGQGGEQQQFMEQFMGSILKGMDKQGMSQEKLNDAFKNMEENPQFDQIADKMLMQFMDKDLLQEPLQETHASYKKYLQDNEHTCKAEDLERYKKQYNCVEQLLKQLEVDPTNKDKLIQLFEEMQEQGDPPKEVIALENPFQNLNQNVGEGGENCRIF